MPNKPPSKPAPASPRLKLLCLFRGLGKTIAEAAELSGYGHVQAASQALSRPAGRAELERITAEIEQRYLEIAIVSDLQKAGLLPRPCSRCEQCANYTPRTQDTPAAPVPDMPLDGANSFTCCPPCYDLPSSHPFILLNRPRCSTGILRSLMRLLRLTFIFFDARPSLHRKSHLCYCRPARKIAIETKESRQRN